MTEPRHLDLVDRLRGQYHLPVNDGAGPLNGSMTFSRQFQTPPIQKEAAAEIERHRAFVEAASYYINRLETARKRRRVRDMTEAMESYHAALASLSNDDGTKTPPVA